MNILDFDFLSSKQIDKVIGIYSGSAKSIARTARRAAQRIGRVSPIAAISSGWIAKYRKRRNTMVRLERAKT